MLAKPDPQTFQILPWRDDDAGVARMFCDIVTPDGEPFPGDPRYVLKRNLERAAEIRYGELVALEKALTAEQERLSELQAHGSMISEEVTSEEIAEIVSKWTGIPVSKMLEGEQAKLLSMEDELRRRVVGQDAALQGALPAAARVGNLENELVEVGPPESQSPQAREARGRRVRHPDAMSLITIDDVVGKIDDVLG